MYLRQSDERSREIKRALIPPPLAAAAGLIEGYASLFGVRDSGGDIVMAGAFARSLQRRSASGVKMLWQHRAEEPIGLWTSLVEDAQGLKVSGRLDLKVARAREVLSLLRGGAIDGLSIGFRALRAQNEKASGGRRLLELDLWEISIVTFPMLAEARIINVKRNRSPPTDVIQGNLALKLNRSMAQSAARNFQSQLIASTVCSWRRRSFTHSSQG